jgi:hypothetical protein
MDLREYPHLNIHFQEVLRPLAEKLRSVLYEGQANLSTHIELLTVLSNYSIPDAILIDGREAEGVRPMTVAEVKTACEFLIDMLQWTQTPENEPRGTTALKMTVRPFRA